MNCPKDRVPLQIVHFHSIPIQRCPKCEGTWYEKDQLRILKDKEAHGDYCWINLDLWRDVAKFRAASSSRYACPADSTPLTPVHYGNANIVVDICQTCKGVWLDKGEYARIIKFLDDTVDAESVGDYLRDLRDEFGEIVKASVGGAQGNREGALPAGVALLRSASAATERRPVSASRLAMGGAPRELGADGLVGRRHREHPAAEVGQRSQRAPSSLAAVAAFARWPRSPPNGQMPPTSETLVGQGLPLHQAGPGDRRLDGAKPRSAVSPGDVIEGAAHLVNPP